MSHLGHYLKPGVRATAPAVLFSVVIDPHIESGARTEHDTFHSWGGADVCMSRFRRGKWSPVKGARCETQTALAEWMESHADRRARNYVVTPDAAESLAMGGVWESIDSAPVKWVPPGVRWSAKAAGVDHPDLTVVRRIAVTQRCTILDYTRRNLRWLWMSARQFFVADEESLAASFQHEWDTDPYVPKPTIPIVRFASERAKLWLRAFIELCDWWRANSRSPFGLTASSLALGILRTHIAPKAITTHTHAPTHVIEREACFGGMCRTWYYGDIGTPTAYHTDDVAAPAPSPYGSIPGPLTHLDVRSMYPFLLREMLYPVARTSYRENVPASEPAQWATCNGVVARVTIETESAEYPCRSGDNVIYPVGRFTTTLTGPELIALSEHGRVVKCHAMALYRMRPVFREAAGALIAMREAARAEGRSGWEMLAKTISTGLGGKLAQRRGCWVERPGVPAAQGFGEWYSLGKDDGAQKRYRAFAWCTSEYVRDKTGAGPYTAAFAYLSAYGRLHMRGLRDECPAGSVVSMDTDGLWILSDGERVLSRYTRCTGASAGQLRLAQTVDAARFYGPRHYYTPGNWLLAGFTRATVLDGGRGVIDSQRFSPLAGPAGAAPRGMCVRTRHSSLAVEAHGVRIGADGWTVPRRRTN